MPGKDGLGAAHADVGHKEVLTSTLEGLAAVAAHSGEYDRGVLLLGVVTRLRNANGFARDPLEQEIHDQIREQLQAGAQRSEAGATSRRGHAHVDRCGASVLVTDLYVIWGQMAGSSTQ